MAVIIFLGMYCYMFRMKLKFGQWQSSCFVRSGGWTERKKLIVAFSNIANSA